MRFLVYSLASIAVFSGFTACSGKTLKPVDSVGETAPNIQSKVMKTTWGEVRITPEKIDDEGLFITVQVVNNSSHPIKYSRKYFSLASPQGFAYAEKSDEFILERKMREQQTDIVGTIGLRGLASFVGLTKNGARLPQDPRDGMVAAGSTHEDTIVFDKKAAGNSALKVTVAKEFAGTDAKNSILLGFY